MFTYVRKQVGFVSQLIWIIGFMLSNVLFLRSSKNQCVYFAFCIYFNSWSTMCLFWRLMLIALCSVLCGCGCMYTMCFNFGCLRSLIWSIWAQCPEAAVVRVALSLYPAFGFCLLHWWLILFFSHNSETLSQLSFCVFAKMLVEKIPLFWFAPSPQTTSEQTMLVWCVIRVTVFGFALCAGQCSCLCQLLWSYLTGVLYYVAETGNK